MAGLLGSALTAWYQLRAERQRTAIARHEEMVKTGRQALMELTQLSTSGTQAIAWLGWSVEVQTHADVQREVERYDTRIRELLPQLLAAEAAAASSSDEAFEQLDPLVNDLIVLDTKVGTAAAGLESDWTSAAKQLSNARSAAVDIQQRTIQIVRSLLRPEFD